MRMRPLRFGEEVRRCLSTFLLHGGGGGGEEWESGRITITYVRVTADLRRADVYIEYHGSRDDILDVLHRMRPDMLHCLSREMYARRLPKLHFHHDRSRENADRIERLLTQERVRRDWESAKDDPPSPSDRS